MHDRHCLWPQLSWYGPRNMRSHALHLYIGLTDSWFLEKKPTIVELNELGTGWERPSASTCSLEYACATEEYRLRNNLLYWFVPRRYIYKKKCTIRQILIQWRCVDVAPIRQAEKWSLVEAVLVHEAYCITINVAQEGAKSQRLPRRQNENENKQSLSYLA